MEKPNFGESNSLASHPKTLEYIARVQAGEDPEKMLQGLPESIKKAVLDGLGNSEKETKKDGPLEDETARDIRRVFTAIGESVEGATRAKVVEYADRIEGGESKESIFQDLAPSFKTGIENILAERARAKKQINDQERIKELKQSLGVDNQEQLESSAEELKTEIKKAYDEGFNFHRRNRIMVSTYADAGINPVTDEIYEKVDPNIAVDFDAHGIAKDNQLENLLALLDKGVDPTKPLYTAPFDLPNELKAGMGAALGTAGGTAYKDGVAVITGGYKELINQGGIKHVFVSDLYSGMLEPLRRLYPQYQFNLLSEQKEVMEKEARASKR